MADKGDVDFDGLELIDMRLEIDVDTLVTYMEGNSEFPGMTSCALPRRLRLSRADSPRVPAQDQAVQQGTVEPDLLHRGHGGRPLGVAQAASRQAAQGSARC